MDRVQVKISPRMICPGGKGYKPMSAEERKAYDDAVQQIAEARARRGYIQDEKNGNQP